MHDFYSCMMAVGNTMSIWTSTCRETRIPFQPMQSHKRQLTTPIWISSRKPPQCSTPEGRQQGRSLNMITEVSQRSMGGPSFPRGWWTELPERPTQGVRGAEPPNRPAKGVRRGGGQRLGSPRERTGGFRGFGGAVKSPQGAEPPSTEPSGAALTNVPNRTFAPTRIIDYPNAKIPLGTAPSSLRNPKTRSCASGVRVPARTLAGSPDARCCCRTASAL